MEFPEIPIKTRWASNNNNISNCCPCADASTVLPQLLPRKIGTAHIRYLFAQLFRAEGIRCENERM